MGKVQTRSEGNLGKPGPFLARVVGHIDVTYMGMLEVTLLKAIPNYVQGSVFQVRYLSPFSGVTTQRGNGGNPGNFNDVQKSYGVWMVPPDIGSLVMVIFIDGEPNEGYWFGCVSDEYQNHMIPGIAASEYVELTPEQKREYDTTYLPVAEFLKSNETEKTNIHRIKKPVHPFAEVLKKQGLLDDKTRGVTSSSARREVPSQVFGISTPGPLDKTQNAFKTPIGRAGQLGYVSRLGGSTFVMDDGDKDNENELVRIRTRTGHQILLHNTKDLVYIANGKGTAWIELTSDGKIDVYSTDSVSIRTETDFNFRADRDINLEAGRNINIRSQNNTAIEVGSNYSLYVSSDAKILVQADKNEVINGSSFTTVQGDMHLKGNNTFMSSRSDMNLISGSVMRQAAGADFNVVATGNYKETATKIYMNGPAAEVAEVAERAESASELRKFTLPNTNSNAKWNESNRYRTENITSIMKRAPTHEPWPEHEDLDRAAFNSKNTDITK